MSFMNTESPIVDGPNGPSLPHPGGVGVTTNVARRNRTAIVAATCSLQTVASGGKAR